ncbi:hypothetical protein R3P38DRAFT_3367024 [Favolaschia claudopus]|uniref:MYND-type domain-containing protein n=1 Tax=Favolaschia claudopus TaxID=2862362 RepID=A0AAW0AB71_9AGAR
MSSCLLTSAQLSAIPPTFRRVARVAADPSSSSEVVATALIILLKLYLDRRFDLSTTIASSFLPLISLILDPARLPPDPTTEPSTSFFQTTCLCASRAIALFSMCSANDIGSAFPTLWPRIWRWIQLMDDCDWFPEEPGSTHGRYSLIQLLVPMFLVDTASEAIRSTPQIGIFVAHTWHSMISCWEAGLIPPKLEESLSAMNVFTNFLYCCASFPRLLDDIVIGAGGTNDLAVVIVKNTRLLVQDAQENGVLRITVAENLFRVQSLTDHLGAGIHRSIWASLAGAGYIQVITPFLSVLALQAATPPPGMKWKLLVLIYLYMKQIAQLTDISPRYMVDAVQCGLLQALHMCGSLKSFGENEKLNIHAPLNHLFDQLARATLDYGSLRDMASSATQAFGNGAKNSEQFPYIVWEEWTAFAELMQSRLRILEEFRSQYSSLRSCANIECGLLRVNKTDLRRCGRCHLLLYCSKECQKLAWTRYEHRKHCRRTTSEGRCYAQKNRFGLFVNLREYQAQKIGIFLQKLEYIYRTGRTDFCVVMQYSRGRIFTSVDSMRVSPRQEALATWDARACREVHVMRLEAKDVEFLSILRCNTSSVLDGLVEIANELPGGVDVMQLEKSHPGHFRRVRELVELEVVESY